MKQQRRPALAFSIEHGASVFSSSYHRTEFGGGVAELEEDGCVGVGKGERRALTVGVRGVEGVNPTSHLRREIHLLE